MPIKKTAAKKAPAKKSTATKSVAKKPTGVKKPAAKKAAVKKSRSGPKFFHGDDLTKTKEDRKRRSTSEPWERKSSKTKKK